MTDPLLSLILNPVEDDMVFIGEGPRIEPMMAVEGIS